MVAVEAEPAITRLLASGDPSLRYGAMVRVLGCDDEAADVRRLGQLIPKSPRVAQLLSERLPDGTIPRHPYAKWDGAHWVLSALADLGYPPGDGDLIPLREQVLAWLLSPGRELRVRKRIAGRARFCASQEGNAIWSLLSLGLTDERVDVLVNRLIQAQWQDGGWNCDRHPKADSSSFHETLFPLRALALYARLADSKESRSAAERAAEVFLVRSLFKRRSDGGVIHKSFVQLHFPGYWHYDILAGLTVMAEAGYIDDERCRDALDLLQSKRLPDGGYPAEANYYRVGGPKVAGRSLVGWGGTSVKKGNPFVTLQALAILRRAGRLEGLNMDQNLLQMARNRR